MVLVPKMPRATSQAREPRRQLIVRDPVLEGERGHGAPGRKALGRGALGTGTDHGDLDPALARETRRRLDDDVRAVQRHVLAVEQDAQRLAGTARARRRRAEAGLRSEVERRHPGARCHARGDPGAMRLGIREHEVGRVERHAVERPRRSPFQPAAPVDATIVDQGLGERHERREDEARTPPRDEARERARRAAR